MFPMIAGSPSGKTYVEDVFSTYLYTGNGSTQTITNGIDLAGKGGMVWTKSRSNAYSHSIFDTARTGRYMLQTDNTSAPGDQGASVITFNSNGYTWTSTGNSWNNNIAASNEYVGWTLRNARNFFQVLSVTKTAGGNKVIDLSPYMTTVGMVRVKRTDAAGSWYTWHRSLSAGQLLIGETTAAAATLGQITVSGTTLTLVDGVIANGDYHIEAYAHDTSADGLIQCGSVSTPYAAYADVSLGWEAQFVWFKYADDTSAWRLLDTSRGFVNSGNDAALLANTSAAESTTNQYGHPTATGFSVYGHADSGTTKTLIYLAIRRGPMKPPTSGTQVYQAAISQSGVNPAYTAGFPIDLALRKDKTAGSSFSWSRMTGGQYYLTMDTSNAEANWGSSVGGFDSMTKWLNQNEGSTNFVSWMFRRSPGVHDQICFNGSGANKTEAIPLLGVPAELWLVKGRSGATEWVWGSSLLAATEKIVMPSPAGKVTDATAWNSTYPTATALSLGTAASVNTSGATYTAYLWATLAGVSKVGKYVGDGAAGKVINCGFAAGARFIMIIRTTASTAQDIFIWDSTRGIIAANDPHLSLNTTAAEVTTDDSVDPDASGFAVNQVAATNINVNGAEYLFLAYA